MGELNQKFQKYTGLNKYDIETMINEVSNSTEEEQNKVYDFIDWNVKRGKLTDAGKYNELKEEILSAIGRSSTISNVTESYTVTFKNGEETVKTVTGVTGTAVEAPTVTKEGFTFGGWSIDGENTVLPVANIGETNITYIALWTEVQQEEPGEPEQPVEYTITFKNGEETVKTVTGVTGTAVVLPEEPEKEGYEFKGWSTDGETVILPTANIGEEDVTYIAVWEEAEEEPQEP